MLRTRVAAAPAVATAVDPDAPTQLPISMNQLLADLRYGVRMLFKTPNATLTVLIALSLGIGVSA